MNQAVVFRLADAMRDHHRRWVHVVIGEVLVSYDPDPLRARLPVADGARLAALYRQGEVLGRDQVGDEYEVMVRLDRWQVERLQHEGVQVTEATNGATLRRVSGA